MTPRILFLDTENAPNLVCTWGIHEQRVSDTDIIHDWFFLSGQWSWNDSKQVNVVSILDNKTRFKKNFRDDYHVVKTISDVIREAHIVVGHNLKGHDWPKLLAKIAEYEITPLPQVMLVDTLDWARRFGFTSRKLSYLCRKLSLQEKLTHSPGAFVKAAMGDQKAIKDIVDYGRGDVPTLRQLYHKLKPYAHSHPNMNLWRGDGVECCPRCGSTEFKKDGCKYNLTTVRQQFACHSCGHKFTSVKSIKTVGMK